MNYCHKCGNELPDGASFCPKCCANIPNTATALPQNGLGTPSPCPPTYLALSIVVTVLCCLPFGIVGIIKSGNVSKEYAAGNYSGALEASRLAKKWSIIGICCGLFWPIIYVILVACGMVANLASF